MGMSVVLGDDNSVVEFALAEDLFPIGRGNCKLVTDLQCEHCLEEMSRN